ncbi:hypothetical protein K9U39_00075 [Rhodoblastus acidophilus]|uniref:Uncharacterized protein n=1 Tax=Candidatus Rhodoblastus alkanivorans TaxID=2954117 RepID=A0ABS9Z3X3_9HYPH|nr:hypothetical protein [Candidatus Rhodoblastus alkanivorans]MCI4677320.1 hypothetical protein [Candidatus Rhodoblastus alkanivorans]MCI4682055.1 hypothetical protein [Candidatus Rhodoblastus alkanivorans]MDI4639357.1 hypothetical protein [Rhodoblastus acidophilus]
MLIVSFGSPSSLSYATANILRSMGDELFGEHVFIQAMFLEELREKWFSAENQQKKCVILFSDCPHKKISELVSNVRSPIALVVEDFAHIVSYVMRSRGMEFAPAARFATQVVCALAALTSTPRVLRISPSDLSRNLGAFVESLCQFYGAAFSDAQIASIMTALAPEGSDIDTLKDYVERHFPHGSDLAEPLRLSPSQRAALKVLSDRYAPLTAGRTVSQFVWPTSLFLKWDEPGAFLEGPIELLGPARFIVCGPYLHLPEGKWRMTVEIETEHCHSDNRLGADIFSEAILTAITAKLPPAGLFAFHLDFEVTNPLAPVEIRIQVLTGCIEGRLALKHVQIDRREERGGIRAPSL